MLIYIIHNLKFNKTTEYFGSFFIYLTRSDFMTYIVLPNDSLLSIAEKFGVEVSDLIKENNLEYIYSLVPGLELIIPKQDESKIEELETEENIVDEINTNNSANNLFSYYIVKKGDNLYTIGKRYNVSPQVIAEINDLDVNAIIYPEQQILVPREGAGIYITKEGDTMESISQNLGILPEDMLINNENIYLQKDQLIAYQIPTSNSENF